MNRRSFLGSILAAGVAPAFVGSSVLMPVRRIISEWEYYTPSLFAFDPAAPNGDWSTIFRYKRVGDLIVVESISQLDFYA